MGSASDNGDDFASRGIAIGASAGGIAAVSAILTQLPEDLDAPIFVVIHIAPHTPGLLDRVLGARTSLSVVMPEDGDEVHSGVVYVAPPDRHLLVRNQRIVLSRGPRENRVRPSVDPLFRSVAVEYGAGAVGIILTGYLDDGTAGLLAIKRSGGTTIVQDPDEATVPEMPTSAIENVDVDLCLRLDVIPEALRDLIARPVNEREVPEDIVLETAIAEGNMDRLYETESMGELAGLGCPECGGPLWKLSVDGLRRYRCHIGHAYSTEALIAGQSEAVEEAFWIALRTLEERTRTLRALARDEASAGRRESASAYTERASEAAHQAELVRDLLLQGQPTASKHRDHELPDLFINS